MVFDGKCTKRSHWQHLGAGALDISNFQENDNYQQ